MTFRRFTNRTVLALGFLWCTADIVQADSHLYLITGTIAWGWSGPVSYLRVDTRTGAITAVREMPTGLDSVFVDPERRRVVIASPALLPTQFVVIDMDSPNQVRTLRLAYSDEGTATRSYLLDVPGVGEVVAVAVNGVTFARDFLALSVGDPGQKESQPVHAPLDWMKYIRLSGLAGGALWDDQHLSSVAGDPLRVQYPGLRGWDIGISRPPYLSGDPEKWSRTLVINNDAVAVLYAGRGAIDLYDKNRKEWRHVGLPFHSARIRAFGHWLAGIAEEPFDLPPGSTVTRGQVEQARGRSRGVSPGRDRRLKAQLDSKSTVEDLFESIPASFPGKLFAYDVTTGTTFQITSSQGDSEVLLIADDWLFYRVNDEIFRAPISAVGLGRAVRIAKGPEIVYAHWAFLGPNE